MERNRTLEEIRLPDRELTAFHEGGHALVGHLLGWPTDDITIVGAKSLRGFTLRRTPQVFRGIVDQEEEQLGGDQLADLLTYLYAGIVAQRLLCTKRGASSESVHLGEDGRVARESVRNLPEEEKIELLDSAEKRAVKLFSYPHIWQILERISTKLLEFGTLDRPSLLELLPRAQYT